MTEAGDSPLPSLGAPRTPPHTHIPPFCASLEPGTVLGGSNPARGGPPPTFQLPFPHPTRRHPPPGALPALHPASLLTACLLLASPTGGALTAGCSYGGACPSERSGAEQSGAERGFQDPPAAAAAPPAWTPPPFFPTTLLSCLLFGGAAKPPHERLKRSLCALCKQAGSHRWWRLGS